MINNNVDFGLFNLHLNLSAEYINSFGELDSFSKDVPFSVTVRVINLIFSIVLLGELMALNVKKMFSMKKNILN